MATIGRWKIKNTLPLAKLSIHAILDLLSGIQATKALLPFCILKRKTCTATSITVVVSFRNMPIQSYLGYTVASRIVLALALSTPTI